EEEKAPALLADIVVRSDPAVDDFFPALFAVLVLVDPESDAVAGFHDEFIHSRLGREESALPADRETFGGKFFGLLVFGNALAEIEANPPVDALEFVGFFRFGEFLAFVEARAPVV